MKERTALVFTLLLTGILSLAQPGSQASNPRALNPQPLPPVVHGSSTQKPKPSKVQLNPQPLPPGAQSINRNTSPGSKVELNPQPLPPGVAAKSGQRK